MVESWEPLADANGPYDGRAVVVKMRANLLKESGGGAQRERRGWEVLLGVLKGGQAVFHAGSCRKPGGVGWEGCCGLSTPSCGPASHESLARAGAPHLKPGSQSSSAINDLGKAQVGGSRRGKRVETRVWPVSMLLGNSNNHPTPSILMGEQAAQTSAAAVEELHAVRIM